MNSAACPVCQERLAEPNVANCHACHRDFHLQMRMDVVGKDCGLVWLHEERMHLVFGCNECLEGGLFGDAAAPDPGFAGRR